MIFPRVKKEISAKSASAVCGMLSLSVDGEYAQDAVKALSLFLPEAEVKLANKAVITAKKSGVISENYHLISQNGRVLIEYSDYLGLRNALATISLMAFIQDGVLYLPDTEIIDFPECSHRGIMLDPARGVMPFERLKNDLILAAKAKMNIFHFHLAESEGLAIEMDCMPESMLLDGAYTKKQVTELCELCRVLGLEIIPEYDMPAHSKRLTAAFQALRCDTDLENPSGWSVCPGTEQTYEVYERIISELVNKFPGGRYFHMGGDELEFRDEGALKYDQLCHWDECRKCKAKMQKEKLADRQELYYYFVRRINDIVKKHGRQMIMWSDQIDCTRPAGIPDDVIMQFWRVAGKGRGPYEGCSMQRQLEMGYTLINSHYTETYVDFESYMTPEKLGTWRWDERPECDGKYKKNIIGSEVCAWEYGNQKDYPHYSYSLPSAIVMMANKLWNGEKDEFISEDAAAITRTLLGARVPQGFNVFKAIGDILPPRQKDVRSYPDKVTVTDKEIEDIISVLSDNELFHAGDAFRAAEYIKCAQYTLENRK